MDTTLLLSTWRLIWKSFKQRPTSVTQRGRCLTSTFFSLWKRKILYFNENNFSQLLFSMFYEKLKHLELKLDFWKQLLFSCTGCEALKMALKLIDRWKQQLETTPTYIDTFWYSSRNFLQSRVSLNLQNLGWNKCFSLLISVFFFSLVFNFLSPKGELFYTVYDFLKTIFIIFFYFFKNIVSFMFRYNKRLMSF